MNVVGLVQARMASSRVPGKVMQTLAGKPLVWHIFDRLRRVRGLSGLVLATTTDPANDALVRLAEDEGVAVFRWHDEDDIVARLVGAARMCGADAMLKVNADCPLADPNLMREVLDEFLADGDADFATNKLRQRYPLGYSVELVSTRALAWCDAKLRSPEDRELVIKWIMEHPERFRAVSVVGPDDNSDLHLCVDTPADMELMAEIFAALWKDGEAFGIDPVMDYLKTSGRIDSRAARGLA